MTNIIPWNLDGTGEPAPNPDEMLDSAKEFPERIVSKYLHQHEQIAALAETIISLGLRGTENEGAIGVAIVRLKEMDERIDALTAELAGVEQDLAHAREELVAKDKALAKAKGEIKVFKAALPPRPRKVGPMKGQADPELRAAAFGGAPVEIVFSDGKGEIPGLAPTVVEGAAAWVRHVDRTLLKQHLTLNGPAPGSRPWSIAGVGLFVDGDQFAWSPFPEPLRIDPGSTVELRDAILV